jgi:hypothetical protein
MEILAGAVTAEAMVETSYLALMSRSTKGVLLQQRFERRRTGDRGNESACSSLRSGWLLLQKEAVAPVL